MWVLISVVHITALYVFRFEFLCTPPPGTVFKRVQFRDRTPRADDWDANQQHDEASRCRISSVLRPVYTCDFSCDFDAIMRTKPAPAYPARVYSRVKLRQNTAKLAEIRKKGVFK